MLRFASLLLLLVLAASSTLAQAPATMSYQAVLTDDKGQPLSDGSYLITTRLYDAATDGTTVWEEQHRITLTDGLLNLTLGEQRTLSALAFDQPYWLGLSINSDAELMPRTALSATPYSLHARTIAADALQAGDNITLTPSRNGIEIAADAGVQSVVAGEGLTGGGDADEVELALADGATVRSLNGLADAITLAAGENISLAEADQTITISATASGLTLPFEQTVEANDATAFDVTSTGTRGAAEFRVDNNNSFNSAILASTNGTGATLFARSFGLGGSALFRNETFGNDEPAVETFTAGSGPALLANHGGFNGDIAIFQSSGQNMARIDKNGVGFFNGGVQSSGADLAETFEVEGLASAYTPGDVLVISTTTDRHVERSQEAYSPLVAGVYATRPGVILTEEGLEDKAGATVPMGVVGVLPTKVSAENGPIRRGDLLVTSTIPGHAMLGTDRSRLFGAVIGKALEDFDGPGPGVIRVLVNVQ